MSKFMIEVLQDKYINIHSIDYIAPRYSKDVYHTDRLVGGTLMIRGETVHITIQEYRKVIEEMERMNIIIGRNAMKK